MDVLGTSDRNPPVSGLIHRVQHRHVRGGRFHHLTETKTTNFTGVTSGQLFPALS